MPSVDWSSLSPDLVSCVGDVFLDAGDIDYYVNLRAVCCTWRAATEDPRGLSRRFRPHRWVMLDDDLPRRSDSRLFLNVYTGRFLCRDLPLNDGYNYIGAADGLLVLEMPRGRVYDIGILNPFTCCMVRFPSSLATQRFRSHVAAGTGVTAPLLCLFLSDSGHPSEPFPRWFRIEQTSNISLCTMVPFQGRVYITDIGGFVRVVDCLEGHKKPKITIITKKDRELGQSFLMDNSGELLLVCVPWRHSKYTMCTHVTKVDFERKTLKPIKSIGNKAIFVGRRCCLSVNVDYLPGIQRNRVYHYDDGNEDIHMYQYHLEDGSRELLMSTPPQRPWSLAQFILHYCRGIENSE